jgi:hypothetical protein
MPRAHRTPALAALPALALSLAACIAPPDGPEPDESISHTVRGLTVDGVAAAGGCSTAAVLGLSEQILAVENCIQPNIVTRIPDRPNLSLGSAVIPYLETPACTSFVAALDAAPGTTMNVTSVMRTIASQYLLYYWYQHGLCGIQVAAAPASSNHESGLAVDVSNYSTWQATLEAHDFTWFGSSDLVHFTYSGGGAVDLSADGVLAFQMLWNFNHPGDLIAEDGAYGPQTEARLQQSPQDGFPLTPSCDQQDAGTPPPPDAAPPPPDAAVPDDAAEPDGAAPPDDAEMGDGAPADGAPAPDGGADDAADAPAPAGAHVLASGCGCAAGGTRGGAVTLLPLLGLWCHHARRRPRHAQM